MAQPNYQYEKRQKELAKKKKKEEKLQRKSAGKDDLPEGDETQAELGETPDIDSEPSEIVGTDPALAGFNPPTQTGAGESNS